MAIKTYTSGSVLTASDMNTYSANSGYVALSKTTFTTTSTAQFTSAFSATYRNYRAVLSFTASAATTVYLRLLVGTTVQTGNILSVQNFSQLSSGTLTVGTRSDQYALLGNGFTTYPSAYNVDFFAPQATDYTSIVIAGNGARSNTDSDTLFSTSRNIVTTAINGFEILTASATTLTGTMTLYGVRDV